MESVGNIRICHGEVQLNGKVLFSSDRPDRGSFFKALYKHLAIDYAKFYKMSPLSRLGFLASEILLGETSLEGIPLDRVALVLANASSSLHTDAIFQESIESKPSPATFVYTLPNIVIGEICIRNGFKGEGLFFIQERYDRDFMFTRARELLENGRAMICLAGWVEIDIEGEYLAELDLLKK
jgi:hypothetical protein